MSTEKLVLGRYRVQERVGRGAMGVIYRGLDPVLDREVAIKVMSAAFADEGADAKRRFFREARAAARLQHRNIVTVFEFAEEDGVPYIVMEFLRGKNLAERLGADPPLALEQKLDIVGELCAGLQYASENGVIHRDVKPANVWLLEDGSVKLVDFGIAKITTATSTLGKDVIGSAAYMSPEQAEGHTVDARTDIFSAAVVLYELVAGVRPFEASTPTATLLKIVQEPPPPITAPDVPAALVATIRKALEKNRADRHQSAGEFGAELRLIRTTLTTGSETGLSDPALGSTTTTTKAAAASSAVTTASDAAARLPVHRWGRLLLAGAVGGLVMTAVLYWANVPRVGGMPPGLQPSVTPVQATPEPAGTAPPVPSPLPTPNTATTPGNGPIAAESPKPAPTINLRAEAKYEFQIRNEKGDTILSRKQSIHNFPVPAGTKTVRLYAPEVLLDKPVSVAGGRVPVPGLGRVVFVGERTDCSPVHRLKADIGPPVKRLSVAEGSYTFDFKCEDGTFLERQTVSVQEGVDATVTVK